MRASTELCVCVCETKKAARGAYLICRIFSLIHQCNNNTYLSLKTHAHTLDRACYSSVFVNAFYTFAVVVVVVVVVLDALALERCVQKGTEEKKCSAQ